MLDNDGHNARDRVLLAGSHWQRYTDALASSFAVMRDVREILEVVNESEGSCDI